MTAEQVQYITFIFPILIQKGLGLRLPDTITFMTPSVQFYSWFLMLFNFRIYLMIFDGNKDSSSPSPTGS